MKHRSHALRTITLVTITLFGAAGSTWCATASSVRTPQESNFDLEGPISKLAAGQLTVDQGQGIFFRVAYDDKTTVSKDDGSPGSEKDFRIGVRVHVIGDLQDSGVVKAQKIEIEAAKAEPSKDAPQKKP